MKKLLIRLWQLVGIVFALFLLFCFVISIIEVILK